MVKHVVFSLVMAVLAGSAFALTNVKWATDAGGLPVSGALTDDACWQGGLAPVPGANLGLIDAQNGPFTVTLPNVTTNFPFWMRVPLADVGKVTLDGRGNTFVMAPRNKDVQGDQPFRIHSTEVGDHVFNVQGYDASNGEALRFENLLLEAWTTSEPKRTTIDVRQGVMDFATTVVKSSLQLFRNPGGDELVYRIGPGATNRFNEAAFDANAPVVNRIVVDGGSLEASGAIQFNGNNATTKELLVTNGGNVAVQNILLGNVTGGSRWRIDVADGSTLAVDNTLKQCSTAGGRYDINVGRDSVFSVCKPDGTYLGNVENSTLNVNLVDGGTMRVTGDFEFTKGNQLPENGGAFLNARTGTLHIVKNAVFRMAQNLLDARDLTIRNEGGLYVGNSRQAGYPTTWDLSFATLDFSDDAVWYIGCFGSSPGHVIITNGTNTIRGKSFCVGKDGGCGSSLTIGGTADVTFGPVSDGIVFNHMDRQGDGCVLNLAGGRTTWKQAPTLGSKNLDRMTVNVTDGTHQFETSIGIGGYALCDWWQSGGSVGVSGDVTLGHWAGFTEPHLPQYFRLTGGAFSANKMVVADGGNRAAVLELNGGVLRANQLYGWGGATVRKPSAGGLAVLHGDGGTLEAKSAQSAFIVALDEARVGADGLTVRTGFDVSICAPWGDLDGADGEGRLVLAGEGTKRLVKGMRDNNVDFTNGALTNGVTVCAGGKVVIADDLPVETALVVTNNAVVSFEGPSTGGTLKGLVLGDAVSGGTLRIDPGDSFVVTGPISLENAALEFTAPPEADDYDFLTVDASVEIDDRTKAAWERMFIAAGHLQGKSYTFSVTTDGKGNSVFGLKVEEAEPLDEKTTWQGPGADWETDANWSAAAPGVRTVAVFADGSAPSEVTLDASVTVGALSFTNETTALVGSGDIGFTDSGYAQVAVSTGAHEIAVALAPSFELPFDVADGAALRMGGPITGGAVAKTGEGALTLAGAGSSLRGAIRVNGGVLAAESLSALGARVGGANKVSLLKGVFAVSNDVADATLAQKLELDAGAKTPAVVRTDENVTVTDFSCVSGNLVKRGAGRLTLAAGGGTVTLARDNGFSGRSFPTTEIVYKGNGSVPDDHTGFSGINVIEGELLLKGTAARAEDTVFDVCNCDWRIGQNTAVSADPVFTLDHATLDARGTHCALGYGTYVTTGTKSATLNLRNGAWFHGNTLNCGSCAWGISGSPEDNVYTRIHASGGSTLETDYNLNLCYHHKGWGEHLFEGGSAVLANLGVGVEVRYPVRAVWDSGSVLAATRTDGVCTPTKLATYNGATGQVTFRNGSVLYVNSFAHNNNGDFRFSFDGGTWDACGDMDFVFRYADKLTIETTGAGLTLPPAAGQTYRMASKISGTGGLVKTGAGTLAFVPRERLDAASGTTPEAMDDPVTWGFDGTLEVREGTVTVANGCTREGALPVKVSPDAELRLASASDVTLLIDLGYSEESPMPENLLGKPIPLGVSFEGEAPANFAKWRVGPTGVPRAKARLTAEDGAVFVTVDIRGMSIIIR